MTNTKQLRNIESNLRNEIAQVGIHGRSRNAIKIMFQNRRKLKKQEVETTAKFFGITIEQAQSMIDKARARNRATHEKGMALNHAVAQGKFAKAGIWA